MLTRLAVLWSATLPGLRFSSIHQENGERFRLGFASANVDLSLIVALAPAHPWMGEAVLRWDGPRWSPDPFVSMVTHGLEGRLVAAVSKEHANRAVRLDFADGRGLAIELALHGANMVLLGEGGRVAGSLRLPKGAKERLTPGTVWSARGLPAGRLDPFLEDAGAIDAALAAGAAIQEAPAATLKRLFVGLSAVGAELALEEHAATGRSPGSVIRERLDSILEGGAEVLIEGEADLPAGGRLLPWRPLPVSLGRPLFTRGGPAATAATFYEARAAAERGQARIAALGAILRNELARNLKAERKIREELRSFADPDRYRLMAEALLAGLSSARRSRDVVVVSDPYDPGGRDLVIPAPPGKSLTQVADDLFRLHRRSRRGLASAGARAETLQLRASRLEALLAMHDGTAGSAAAGSLEAAMREEGLPVGLLGPTRAARAAARHALPRLAGVRMIASTDGFTILVGRTGPDNDRLTFKLASPEDIWLHAAGVHGAHVVILNPDRCRTVPAATLTEAARLALWFSDARSEAAADVHWTRRKYVRRAHGGAPGRVVLKRFETLRVRAEPPREPA